MRIVAPPLPAQLAVNANEQVVPSAYANDIKRVGLTIITWIFERADLRGGASKAGFDFAFDAQGRTIRKDSDIDNALDVLACDMCIIGIFSDWPATVTYDANCMGR